MTVVIFEKDHGKNLVAVCLDLILLDEFFDRIVLGWRSLFSLHCCVLRNTTAP
jgi:hypothetical protein